MFGIQDPAAFAFAVLLFLMIPGPGTFAILTATGKGNTRGGAAALAGLMLGDWVLMSAAMLGVAALLAAHPSLFKAVQWLGVAYLVYVGVQLLRAPEVAPATLVPVATGRWFRMGLLVTLVNPKAIVFYMAFFPLFIAPGRYQGLPTLIAMGVTVSLITLAYGALLVGIGHWAAQRLGKNPALRRWLARAAGVALVAFGVRLATE